MCRWGWVGEGGERYEVNTLCTMHSALLDGGNTLQLPLEGVGPENRDFFGPEMATSKTHVHKITNASVYK